MAPPMAMLPKLTLTYFDFGGGRVEATRLAFFLADIPFVDVRIPHDGFAGSSHAACYPYEMLPVLQVDDQVLAESMAMLRFAGRLAGLYPANDPLGCLLIDEILELVELFTEKCLRWEREPVEEQQQEMEKELLTKIIPQYFHEIDNKLQALQTHATFADTPGTAAPAPGSAAPTPGTAAATPGVAGDPHTSQIFIHDLVLRSFVTYIIRPDWETFVLDKSHLHHWLASVSKVESHPKIQQYMALEKAREQAQAAAASAFTLLDLDTGAAGASRGEPIRLALRLGGLEFVDDRVDAVRLEQLQPTLPFPHQLPVLKTSDGRMISRSYAILRYVGTLTGLYPSGQDPLRSFRIDELLGQLEELTNTWYFPVYATQNETKQSEYRATLTTKAIPKCLGQLDRRVESWAAPYATGDALTIADLAIHGVLAQLRSGLWLAGGHAEPARSVDVSAYSHLAKIDTLVKAAHSKLT